MRRANLFLIAVGAAIVLCAPSAAAGDAQQPELTDPVGDVVGPLGAPAIEPWKDVVDIVSFWVTQDNDTMVWHWQFHDFSQLSQGELADAANGRVIYSITSFDVSAPGHPDSKIGGDSVYFDDVTDPKAKTGWRFDLQHNQTPLNGTVDKSNSRVEVRIPLGAIGSPPPGARVGHFAIQATTSSNVDTRSSDFAPDRGPCDCFFIVQGSGSGAKPANSTVATDTSSAGGRAAPSMSTLAVVVAIGLAGLFFARRR